MTARRLATLNIQTHLSDLKVQKFFKLVYCNTLSMTMLWHKCIITYSLPQNNLNSYELLQTLLMISKDSSKLALGLFHGQTLIIRNKKINIKNNLVPRALFLFDIGTAEKIKILILGRRPNIKKE